MAKSPTQLFENVVKPFTQFERWFKVWLGPRLMLCTSNPTLAEAVLSHPKCLEKPFFYRFVQLEHGILTRNYDKWKRYRKILSPAFSTGKVSNALPLFIQCASNLISKLDAIAEPELTISLAPLLSECMLSIIFSTTLGVDAVERREVKNILKHLDRLVVAGLVVVGCQHVTETIRLLAAYYRWFRQEQ
uniref:Cytochrome P450 n=1 Tax=Anopheles farauti TaxID=69004 RepID=A0A182Q9Q7_9DIPT